MMLVVGMGTGPIWLILFAISQTADALTTAIDRHRGAIEAMPASAALLVTGGPIWFWVLKLILVVPIGAALVIAARWVRRGASGSSGVYRFVLLGIQLVTVATVLVSLQNAVLAASL